MDSLPLAFGQKRKGADREVAARIESTKRKDAVVDINGKPLIDDGADDGVVRQRGVEEDSDNDQDRDEDDDGSFAIPDGEDLPVTHEVVMKDHKRTVSALSIDASGTRVASGGYDYEIKLWDFGGMNASFKPFQSWEGNEGHPVRDIQYSNAGDRILVATGNLQPKLYDRDGNLLAEFLKGDMYLRDLRHTDGHVGEVSTVQWNPKKANVFLSASADSTIRIWDTTNRRKSKSVIVVKSKEKGSRTRVSSAAWSGDGRVIGAACEDGTVNLWAANSNFAKPSATVLEAHEKGTITGSMSFTRDGRQLITRGGDNTVKLWDARLLKKPVFTIDSLPVVNSETNVIFSPDEKYILTGTAGKLTGVLPGQSEEDRAKLLSRNAEGGKVVVIKRETGKIVRKLDISDYSVVRVLWHERINQVLTGSADGSIHVLYSPQTSVKGATLAVTKAPKKRAVDDYGSSAAMGVGPIHAPDTLPMFAQDRATVGGGKRPRMKDRHDAKKTMKPMPPMTGPGRGGRVGSAATAHIVQGLIQNDMRSQDPREALLKYATADPNENTWTKAWAQTQPKGVFDENPEYEGDEKDQKKK